MRRNEKNPLYANPEELKRPSGSPGVRKDEPGRSPFRKDYGRLLHAPSFRRLQGKTQLFPGLESDFFRNRLTHSLEVAQIASGIASFLNTKAVPKAFGAKAAISVELVEFAAIAHDLGHPPFGHNGEYALDELMREHGGFEGNAQTLRILSTVERKLVNDDASFGLDLTYRTLASVLKYDRPIKMGRDKKDHLRKGYYATESKLVSQIKRRVAPGFPKGQEFKTLECAIMDIADDIAYSTYDLEDSLHACFLTPSVLLEKLGDPDVFDPVSAKINEALADSNYPELSEGELFRVAAKTFDLGPVDEDLSHLPEDQKTLLLGVKFGQMDRAYCIDGLVRARFTATRVGQLITAVELLPNEQFPQLSKVRLRRPELLQVELFKHLNYALVIRSPRLAVVEHRGKGVIFQIFKALEDSNGALLPPDWQERYEAVKGTSLISSASARKRVICDYIACMTDRYAAEVHSRLFGEGSSIFKPL